MRMRERNVSNGSVASSSDIPATDYDETIPTYNTLLPQICLLKKFKIYQKQHIQPLGPYFLSQ